MTSRPGHELAGRTLVVTRAADDAEPWLRAIEERGGRGVHLPCIEHEELTGAATRAALSAALERADWLALTSRRGAAAVAALGGAPARVRVAAVGPATADACRALLGRCDLVASEESGRGLAEELAARLGAEGPANALVVVAAAEDGRRDLEERLPAAGARVERVAVYRTRPLADNEPLADLGAVDAILLASPSAARGFACRARVRAGARIVTIGPTTTAAARELGLGPLVEARRPSLDALLEAAS